jgi:hypothetical protein
MPGPGDVNGSTSAEVLEEALSGHLARLAGAKTPLLPTVNFPNTTVWATYTRPTTTNQRPYKA